MAELSEDGFYLDEWGREYGYCNSCGEEAPADSPCCAGGEVVPPEWLAEMADYDEMMRRDSEEEVARLERARAERAEAVIAEALDVARSASVPLGVPEAMHYDRLLAETRRVLSTYEKGATQK